MELDAGGRAARRRSGGCPGTYVEVRRRGFDVRDNRPFLSEALSKKGEFGYSKVRALTRAATADNEANLLEIGRHGTGAHVEKLARLYRQASRANETDRADARHRERGLTFWHEDDGTAVLHGRFPPEMAARILVFGGASRSYAAIANSPRTACCQTWV